MGTLYKQVSAFTGRKTGAALVSRNIAQHVETSFMDKPKSWRPLVYCWRGGKRSEAMVHILREIGWDAQRLEGGYKAYRRTVVAELPQLAQRYSLRVVCGLTGSGKSRLLQALSSLGAQVLDLEKLAAHRGSVLGNLPDQPQPSQKMFESRIWWRLRSFETNSPVFVESESKRIGTLQVPRRPHGRDVGQRMRASRHRHRNASAAAHASTIHISSRTPPSSDASSTAWCSCTVGPPSSAGRSSRSAATGTRSCASCSSTTTIRRTRAPSPRTIRVWPKRARWRSPRTTTPASQQRPED